MTIGKTLALQSRQEKEVESSTLAKKGQSKTLVALGSLSAYVRMKEKSGEKKRLSKQIESLPEELRSSRQQQMSYSGLQLFDGDSTYRLDLVEEDEGFQTSDDYVSEEEKDADLDEIENDVVNIVNESIPDKDQQNDQLVLRKEKQKRGPSMCKDVHGWTINDCKPIILNELGQSIGPDKVTLDKFSRFLGSLARDSNLAPLNELSWPKVPGKDNIWDYVKKKYMIADEGKDYVLQSVGALWRAHKSRIKLNHYIWYKNEVDRWDNQPPSMPKKHFKDLLAYWDLEEVQKISEKNKENREGQKYRPTKGPMSFARKRHVLEQAQKNPPSEALMYIETRKRTPGRKYKTSYEPIQQNIDQMEKMQTHEQIGGDDANYDVIKKPGCHKLVGRCAKRMKKPSKSGVLIPDEFLMPYKAQIVTDTVGEVMKIFKQQLSPEMLASIAPSLGDPLSVLEFANHLINGQSSGGLNDIEQCQVIIVPIFSLNDGIGILGDCLCR